MRTGQRVLFSVATSNWPARREGGGVQGIPYAWRVLDLINRISRGMPMRSKEPRRRNDHSSNPTPRLARL